MLEQLELVKELEKIDSRFLPVRTYQQTVLNSAELWDLLNVYSERSCNAYKRIGYNISRRMHLSKEKEAIFKFLMFKIDEAEYVMRLRLRSLVDSILADLSSELIHEYFDYFIKSNFTYEYHAAIRSVKLIWSDDIQQFLITLYKKQRNFEILKVLDSANQWSALEQLLEFTWASTEDKYYRHFFKKNFSRFSYTSLIFLKDCDIANYLHALSIHNKTLTDEQAREMIGQATDDDRAFVLWRLSNINKWDIVRPEVVKFIEQWGENID